MSIFTQYCQGPLTQGCSGGAQGQAAGAPTQYPITCGGYTHCSGIQTGCYVCNPACPAPTPGDSCCSGATTCCAPAGQAAGAQPYPTCSATYTTCCQGGAQDQAVARETAATVCTLNYPTCTYLTCSPTRCSGVETCCCGVQGQAAGAQTQTAVTVCPTGQPLCHATCGDAQTCCQCQSLATIWTCGCTRGQGQVAGAQAAQVQAAGGVQASITCGPMTQCSGVETCCRTCFTQGQNLTCMGHQTCAGNCTETATMWPTNQHTCSPTQCAATGCAYQTCGCHCGAQGQAQGPVTGYYTCGGQTVCSGVQTCCGPCTDFPTCGGPTRCSGIQTCCCPVGAQAQAAGQQQTGITCPGPTICPYPTCHVTACAETTCHQATCVCGAQGQAQGPVTEYITCGGPSVCSGIQTCCGPATVCYPTGGGPTHCSGIQTCCCPGGAQAQAQGPVTNYITCGGPTHCGGIYTCGITCTTAPTCVVTCTPTVCAGCGAQGQAAGGAVHTQPPITCGGPTQCIVPTCGVTACVETSCHGAQAQAAGPVTDYVTCGGPTVCHGIWTCAPGCPPPPPTQGPITLCRGVHTCGPPTSCVGITCACGG